MFERKCLCDFCFSDFEMISLFQVFWCVVYKACRLKYKDIVSDNFEFGRQQIPEYLQSPREVLQITSFCWSKPNSVGQFYVVIVILEFFVGHLSDRIKYFVSQNEIMLILTDRALFVKTVCEIFSRTFPNLHY